MSNNVSTTDDDERWGLVLKGLNTLSQLPTVLEKVFQQRELSAPFYDSRAINLPAGEVFQVFGYDASRIRFYLRASDADVLQVGHRDQVTAGLGWVVPTASPVEFHTVDEIFVIANAPATLYLWAEYRKN